LNKTLALAALALSAVLLAPAGARADWGIRAGLEAPLATHTDSGSYSIGDSLQPGLDVMVLKGPSDFIALGAELKVGFASTSDYRRTGTTIGPNLTINIPALPLFLRGALPIKVEPGGVALGLRLAVGFKINLPVLGFYFELTGDMPIVGKDSSGFSPDAFSTQTLGAGLGIELRI
jgi:hypothetical protein